jgi:hypothetical protein
MTSGARPGPPFQYWPVQLHEEGFGFVWYAEPAAFVFQATAGHGDVAFAEHFNDLIDRVLAERQAAVREAGGLFILHDWRAVTGYDKDARSLAVARMKRRPRGYARRTIVAVNPQSRLLRMAVEAVNLFATVTLASKIELVTNLDGVVERSGILRPERGSHFP